MGRLTWAPAEVVGITHETPKVRTLALRVPGWPGHRPGQHIDVRLTAEDGYQAQRSYSLASAPEAGDIEITVEKIEDGEVSPYLVDEVIVGDVFEIRGPVGGYFVWDGSNPGPLFLVGGGSGVVPLMSMIRHAVTLNGNSSPVRLLYSSRSLDDVIYRQELEEYGATGIEVIHTLTRSTPDGWRGYSRRVDEEMIAETTFPAARNPTSFICGPTAFVESVAGHLVGAGHPANRIKTERFGPSGS